MEHLTPDTGTLDVKRDVWAPQVGGIAVVTVEDSHFVRFEVFTAVTGL
jgi:hypothetical protein